MRQAKCPACFTPLPPHLAVYRCRGNCAESVDERASAYRGFDVQAKPAVVVERDEQGRLPGSAVCTACGGATDEEICPTCGQPLPAGWRGTSTTCIALAGAPGTGKSVYIAVAVKQLQWLASALGGVLAPVDQSTVRSYQQRYESVLYEARGLMPSTPPQRRGDASYEHSVPLLYQLSVPGHPQHVIVLRDVAGEDLLNPEIDRRMFAFFAEADAVIFLVDPMQVPAIRDQLLGLADADVSYSVDPHLVLHNVASLQRRVQATHPVPLAVTLSKFDTIQHFAELEGSTLHAEMSNLGAAYRRDPSMEDPAYDPVDRDLLNAELQSFLPAVSGRALLNYARQEFPALQWFCVSALGHQPKGSRVGVTGITPFRCLDPLKWALHQAGVIPVTAAR